MLRLLWVWVDVNSGREGLFSLLVILSFLSCIGALFWHLGKEFYTKCVFAPNHQPSFVKTTKGTVTNVCGIYKIKVN